MNQAIDFIAAEPNAITVDGVEVVVAPLRVKQLPELIRHIEPLLDQLMFDVDTLDKSRLLALLGDHGEAIIAATAICTNQSKEWVGNLLPDRLVALALMSVEVNANFFTQALPSLKTAVPQLAPNLAQKIMLFKPKPASPGPMPSAS